MQVLNEKTNRMPGVSLDAENHAVLLEGEAYPEDVAAAFEPLMTSISTTLAESGETPMTVKFQLQYFNSGSSRKILEIIKMIDASDTAHNIEWLADPEDDEMIDHGNRFSRAVSKAGFTVVEEEL
ncbi:MAG: DUF1987 domain-containing protein [Alphaproteobacteria bacterium]|jgi:hypothetical protein|nr:hypothetical protein [Rhodospirillaceae bacterium]MBL6626242.1 DUF1987 domain-containing protein [Alphaproteobacteria bacterium]MBL6673248.1 DUF1987 domain-containing protein [Alphaproteobacteria bacterium]HAO57646.1 hypothetical protein [Alphaproteobacteria bacterium]HBP59300.1 hypothetical protein [Alphaproteobacteria bacterium]|tara:strand:+ start:900 stop:1274 length:375 start_codon:yes stop_codon:yes gene_type:complete